MLVESWEQCKDADVLLESPSAMAGVHIAEALREFNVQPRSRLVADFCTLSSASSSRGESPTIRFRYYGMHGAEVSDSKPSSTQ